MAKGRWLQSGEERLCPGCGLTMRRDETGLYEGYYQASPECWSLFTEVLGREFGNAVLFGQVHQMTVDAYAVQHAGGAHPDKSVDVHLVGLYLMLEKGAPPPRVAPLLQRLAARVQEWPHFPGPSSTARQTVLDVALCASVEEHADAVRRWAREVWETWAPAHREIAVLASQNLEKRPWAA